MSDNQPKLIRRALRGAVTGEIEKPLKKKSVRSEELTPEQRAELELKHTARELRGRPPSI